MARGDAVQGVSSVAAAGFLTFQPAAGVEVMITEIGSSLWVGTPPAAVPDIEVSLYDGSDYSQVRKVEGVSPWERPLKLLITNDIYLAIKNTNASTAILSYCGVQTK